MDVPIRLFKAPSLVQSDLWYNLVSYLIGYFLRFPDSTENTSGSKRDTRTSLPICRHASVTSPLVRFENRLARVAIPNYIPVNIGEKTLQKD